MESPLPQINQTQAQEHEHNAKAPEPCIRHIQDLGYPEFHLLRKSKIRQPFDNHDHTQYTEKKIHQSINPFQFPEQKHPGTYCLPSTGASRQEFCATKKNSQTAPGAIWLPPQWNNQSMDIRNVLRFRFRLSRPIFFRIRSRWDSMVLLESPINSAISLEVIPIRTSLAICSSDLVNLK